MVFLHFLLSSTLHVCLSYPTLDTVFRQFLFVMMFNYSCMCFTYPILDTDFRGTFFFFSSMILVCSLPNIGYNILCNQYWIRCNISLLFCPTIPVFFSRIQYCTLSFAVQYFFYFSSMILECLSRTKYLIPIFMILVSKETVQQ